MMRQRNSWHAGQGRWSLRTKMLALVLGGIVVAGAVVLTVSLGRTGRTVRAQVRQRFALAATGKMASVVDTLTESLAVLRGIGADDLVGVGCRIANKGHNVGSVAYLGGMNQQWLRDIASKRYDSQLIRAVVDPESNRVVAQLRRHITGVTGIETSGAQTPEYVQILVTDSLGAVVAATQRPELYYYGSSQWWTSLTSAAQGQPYVGVYRPIGTPDPDIYIELAVPIYDSTGTPGDGVPGDFIGAVYARIRVERLLEPMMRTNPSDHAETLIIDKRAQILVGTEAGVAGTIADSSWWQRPYDEHRQDHYHEAQMVDGPRVLLGHAAASDPQVARRDDAAVLDALGWILYVYEPTETAYAAARRITLAIWAWGGPALVVVVLVSLVASRSFTQPFQPLLSFVARLEARGTQAEAARDQAMGERARIIPHREVGALARALNGLLDERDALRDELAAHEAVSAADRTRRQRDVALTSSIGERVAQATDVGTLTQHVVELVREHYGLYYAGLYLVDDAMRWAVLQAGTGEPGRELLAQAHRVVVGSGLVGECVSTGRVQLAQDLATGRPGSARGDTPSSSEALAEERALPYARSEVAVPLRSRGGVLGVLVADSYESETFDDEMVVAMRVIADQVAVAIDGLRLFAETQAATERLQRAYGELTRQTWLEALGEKVGVGYEALASGVHSLPAQRPDDWNQYQRDAWAEGQSVVAKTLDRAGVSTERCVFPIRVRESVIGVLDAARPAADGDWTRGELDSLEGLADQLGQALERARLYEAAQQSAREAQLVGGVTRRLRETLNVDAVLQTALQELRAMLDLEGVEVRVGVSPSVSAPSGESEGGSE